MDDSRMAPGGSADTIGSRILRIRGQRGILDADLAELYGVPTKRLNEQVRRNAERFPLDFAFRLTAREAKQMRSQIATALQRNVRHLPLAFTEHGAIMAANVLNSGRAVQASVLSYGRLRACGACWPRMPTWRDGWTLLRISMTGSSGSYTPPSAISWRRRPRRPVGGSGSIGRDAGRRHCLTRKGGVDLMPLPCWV